MLAIVTIVAAIIYDVNLEQFSMVHLEDKSLAYQLGYSEGRRATAALLPEVLKAEKDNRPVDLGVLKKARATSLRRTSTVEFTDTPEILCLSPSKFIEEFLLGFDRGFRTQARSLIEAQQT